MDEKFNRFYNLYKDEVFSYVLRILGNYDDAMDITQEVFYKLYKNLNKIDENKVKNWLFKVCHNLIIDIFRKQKRIYDIDEFSESIEANEKFDIEEFLKILPANYKEVIILKYIYNYQYNEISQILGINENTIKTWIRRAKEMLRSL
jgi:RNA polymerase sigma factor, sigma-70 family